MFSATSAVKMRLILFVLNWLLDIKIMNVSEYAAIIYGCLSISRLLHFSSINNL